MAISIVEWRKEGLTFDASVDNLSFKLDGNKDRDKAVGITPKPLLLTSLAGCTAMDVISLLEKMIEEVLDFSVEVDGVKREEHPTYYETIKLIYKVKGNNLDFDKIKKAVDLSLDKYCGVYFMLNSVADISYEIIIGE